MDAMASRYASGRISQLWQAPLLLLSLGLFGYAAYLFIDPKPGPTIADQINGAKNFVKVGRGEAAIEQLNKLLDSGKLDRDQESQVHLALAAALDNAQQEEHLNIAANHLRIIEQIRIALAQGAKPDAEVYKRMGESYDALDRPTEALESYRKAMALDPERSLSLQRKVIALQLSRNDIGPAEAGLDEYLKDKRLTDSERAWAIGEKAQLLIDRKSFAEAKSLLVESIKPDAATMDQGQVNYRLGYCAWKMGNDAEAERLMRLAREQFKGRHPLDADAAFALGKIYEARNDPKTAQSFFQDVLTGYPDAQVATLAKLGRGLCRIRTQSDDAAMEDMHSLVAEVSTKESRKQYVPQVVTGLKEVSTELTNRGKYDLALEALTYEQQLTPDPVANFYSRLAVVYEHRADQLEKMAPTANPADHIKKAQQVREMRTRAGDAYVAFSRALTLTDDRAYGDALWKGIDLYDRAGNMQSTITALDLFVAERPQDPLAPEALLRLGMAYQAAGMFDKAVAAFQRNQFRYPQSFAASKSAVPLAQAYIAKGPDSYGRAESVLRSVIENNPMLTPDAAEFKSALFELAQLYYRTNRFEEAIARLEEMTKRYPDSAQMGQLLFLMGDSYRKCAGLLDVRIALADKDKSSSAAVIDRAEATAAKKDRLTKAKGLFDKVVDVYRAQSTALNQTDQLYLKLAHFYRADCLYDLADYEDAIKAYDAAAFRYQEDPSALAAYVQIVNSYCALGKMEEAKTANERAKWLLRRMPQEAFTDGSFAMPKAYWEQWLKWTSSTGMW
jgi:tetratricopeptide (TPR) repeat protein